MYGRVMNPSHEHAILTPDIIDLQKMAYSAMFKDVFFNPEAQQPKEIITAPLVIGPAIDGEETNECHQFSSVTHSPDGSTLHYSVKQPSGELDCNSDYVQNACDVLTDKKAFKTQAGRKKANDTFSQIMAKIKPDKQSYFVKDVPTQAITFDIAFDNDFEIKSIDYRLTTAIMTDKITCEEAKKNVASDNPHEDLKAWHDFIMHQKYGEVVSDGLNFETVTNYTTHIIQSSMYDYSMANGIGGIFVVRPRPVSFGIFDGKSKYGSTLNQNDWLDNAEDLSSRALFQSTANREAIHSINMAALKAFKNGKEAFSNDFLNAVLSYKQSCAEAINCP